jgi:spore coat polysaccharide biosynthesis protein SpsF
VGRYVLRLGVIIQARMGSTRLPGKVLMKLGNKNLLEHILYRLNTLQHSANTIIATTVLEEDSDIEDVCNEYCVTCFRGSECDVLERYYLCAKQYNFNYIVRLTADNPFIDVSEIDNLIDLHLNTSADYSRSFSALPKGVGSEIFTFESLEESYQYGKKDNHKEHVNEYIEENEKLFKISELTVNAEKNRPDISLTVDTVEDYKKASFIFNKSKKEKITTEEAIELCSLYV